MSRGNEAGAAVAGVTGTFKHFQALSDNLGGLNLPKSDDCDKEMPFHPLTLYTTGLFGCQSPSQ